MPVQSQIPPDLEGYDIRYNPRGGAGGEYSGRQYLFLSKGMEFAGENGIKLYALRSDDLGSTWTIMASITWPDEGTSIGGVQEEYTVCFDGNIAYILGTDTVGPDLFSSDVCGPLYLWTYNLSTDSFSGPTSTGIVVSKLKDGFGDYRSSTNITLKLIRRGAGDFVLFYTTYETTGGWDWARVSYVNFNGSTFGTSAQVGGQSGISTYFNLIGAAFDSTGYLHVVFTSMVSHTYYHVGMDLLGSWGSLQTLETDAYYDDYYPENPSGLIAAGSQVMFAGLNGRSTDTGVLNLYYATGGSTNPSWTVSAITISFPVIGNSTLAEATAMSIETLSGNVTIFYTCTGTSPNWEVNGGYGQIRYVTASLANLSSWTADVQLIASGITFGAIQVSSYVGDSLGIGVVGNFGDDGARTEQSWFNAIPGAGATPVTRSVNDSLAFSDLVGFSLSKDRFVFDAFALADGTPLIQVTGIDSGPPPPVIPPLPPPEIDTHPNPMSCVFEFYGMETPEDVETLPVPKKYDQLGPMRFDKIGKIFGFRVKLIATGTTQTMPFMIYGDDSESLPNLNSPFYTGTFPVVPNIDKVYEIQLPKSVNTDVFRLALGPVGEPFHRYDVTIKVHVSGMPGQARWIPVR